MNSKSLWGDTKTQYFYELSPDVVLSAIDHLGFKTNGRLMTLNSLENRVYDLEIDNHEQFNLKNTFIVTKFYRPGRWTKEQIQEEHDFLFELEEAEIPVVTPLKINNESLFLDESSNLYFSVFPKYGGRAPDELNLENAERLGSLIARVHQVGKLSQFQHRLTFNAETFIKNNSQFVLHENILPSFLENRYQSLTEYFYNEAHYFLSQKPLFRIHGDCHIGNILFREEKFTLIDFDDSTNGPAIQDLWLLCSSQDEEGVQIRNALLQGYEQFSEINPRDISYIEILRTMRLIHYQAWLTKRREDPTFINHFGDLRESSHWQRHINDLEEQRELVEQIKHHSFDY